MGGSRWSPALLAAAAAMLLAALAAPPASASTGDIIAPSKTSATGGGFGLAGRYLQRRTAGTGVQVCSVETPSQFFETAAAHPNWGFTQFIVRTRPIARGKPRSAN